VSDIVVVTETRVDVVTVTGSGTTDTIQVIGDKQIEVLTMGVQGPQGPGSVLSPATTTTLGGVIVGDNLSINANGLLSAQNGMIEISNVTYGVSQIPNILGGNNARYVAGMKANTTTATIGNQTVFKESYSGLAYNSITGVAVGHISGFTDTYSDPIQLFKKEQYEVRASTLSYSALDQANQVALSAGFSVAASGGAKLFFRNNIDDISTDMQVDAEGVTIFTNGVVTVNGDEVVTLEVAKTLFAPLTFKGS
jgi:hypothetical protein